MLIYIQVAWLFFSVFYSLIHVCSVSVMSGIFYIRIILILVVRTWWFKLSEISYFNNQNTKIRAVTTKFDFEIGNFIAVLYFLHRKYKPNLRINLLRLNCKSLLKNTGTYSPEVQKCKFLHVGRGFIVINGEVIHDFFANYYGTRCIVDECLINRRSKAE